MQITSFAFSARHFRRAIYAALLTSTVAMPAAANTLENPADGGTYSGVGLVSGWHCGTTELTVVVDEGTPETVTLHPSYGTTRNDTLESCGHADTGFGILWNYGLFEAGEHTAQAYANGQPFGATHTFTVVRIDPNESFVRDLEGSFLIEDFPVAGDTLSLTWSQSQQGMVMSSFAGAGSTAAAGGVEKIASTAGNFEVPAEGSAQSGIIVISGWACEAENVTIEIDDGAHSFEAAYGTERGDTEEICGHPNTGFGVLWNTNLLGPGMHEAVALVDGEALGSATFSVTEIDGNDDEAADQDFLRDLEGTFALADFPTSGQTSEVSWSQSTQNFVISAVNGSGNPTPTATPSPTPGPGPSPSPSPSPGPGPSPSPSPSPGPGPSPSPSPSPDPSPSPSPSGPYCGDGILDVDLGEECDDGGVPCEEGEAGEDCRWEKFDYIDCEDAYGGYSELSEEYCSGELSCTAECKIDGSACSCECEGDWDCQLPSEHEIDCGPTYCVEEICTDPDDLEFCTCEVLGACQSSTCVTTPVDPNSLEAICLGVDPEFPEDSRCSDCELF